MVRAGNGTALSHRSRCETFNGNHPQGRLEGCGAVGESSPRKSPADQADPPKGTSPGDEGLGSPPGTSIFFASVTDDRPLSPAWRLSAV